LLSKNNGLDMKKILIIEDQAPMAKILADILTKEKFEVITAINGQIGVEKAIESNPDLIITDNMMPVKTGLEVIVELRARKEFQTTPIFMITAKAGHQDPALAKEAGATGFIKKPFSPGIIIEEIKALLNC